MAQTYPPIDNINTATAQSARCARVNSSSACRLTPYHKIVILLAGCLLAFRLTGKAIRSAFEIYVTGLV